MVVDSLPFLGSISEIYINGPITYYIPLLPIRSFSSSSVSFYSYDFHLKVRTRSSLGKVEGISPFTDIVFESSATGDCCERVIDAFEHV